MQKGVHVTRKWPWDARKMPTKATHWLSSFLISNSQAESIERALITEQSPGFWGGEKATIHLYVCFLFTCCLSVCYKLSPTACLKKNLCTNLFTLLHGSPSGPQSWYFVQVTCLSHTGLTIFCLQTGRIHPLRVVMTKTKSALWLRHNA